MGKRHAGRMFALFLLMGLLLGGNMIIGSASEDSLVSLGYLNSTVIPEIEANVETLIEEQLASLVSEEGITVEQGGGAAYESLQVFKGQTVLGSEGCELILRIGNAIAVCPGENGLVDATGGLDLTDGLAVVKNHVYIIPREDGRGIVMQDDGYLMIKGGYEIVEPQ